MINRHHELTFGERVFDANTMLVYHIVGFNMNGLVELGMSDGDIRENELMFDCELTEEDYDRTAFPADLYQFVPDLVARDGNPVCYEHNKLGEYEEEGGDYPYYSPYLDENLYTFETFTLEEYERR